MANSGKIRSKHLVRSIKTAMGSSRKLFSWKSNDNDNSDSKACLFGIPPNKLLGKTCAIHGASCRNLNELQIP